MVISHLEALSQTAPSLILPNEINGKEELDISTIPNFNSEKFGYEYLSVFVKSEGEEYNSNAVQGRYTIEDDYLIFSPYFPFEKGMTYMVRTKKSDENYAYQAFQVERKEAVENAKVVCIYPLANELPENLLRFYFYFNTPMKKGQALNHIQLIDNEGKIDNHAFMEFKQELWSADGKRLTLLFDPGRIKRGVSTNLEMGPALLEGNEYQLNILGTWQDVYGQELSVNTTKEFTVVKAYRQHIKLNELEIEHPKANSYDTLNIYFNRIIDHALVRSMIGVEDENGALVVGSWEISEDEKSACFVPENNWQKGDYQIILDERLEDVAGNNLNSLLDQKAGIVAGKSQKLKRQFSL